MSWPEAFAAAAKDFSVVLAVLIVAWAFRELSR
jgi:hypothetical protein